MLLLILLSILAFLYWMWLKRETHTDEPPTLVRKIKLNKLIDVVGDYERLWKQYKNLSPECLKLDGALKMCIGPRTVYVITDPDDFLTVSNACLQKDPLYSFAKNFLDSGLITADVSKWKVHRKLLNPLFGIRGVHTFMGIFNRFSRQLVKHLEVEVGKGPFIHESYIRRHALETICMTALGSRLIDNIEIKNKYTKELGNIMNIYFSRLNNFLYHTDFFYNLSSLKRREDICIESLSNISTTILNEVKENVKKEECTSTEENQLKGLQFKPFIRVLLETFANSKEMTDRDIRHHVDTFIAAGEDTNALATTFCLLLVGSYPQIQEKIHDELKEIFGNDDRDVTKADLPKLVYLDAVIKETMRFYPIVPGIGRYLDKNVKLRNCTLSKGRSVILSIYGIHRHPMWGPDADEFRPERWLAPLSNYQKIFAGFSMGRRICIGKTYAMASLKVTLVHIFRNYIIYGDHTKMKLTFEIVIKPVSGHHISIEKRKQINSEQSL